MRRQPVDLTPLVQAIVSELREREPTRDVELVVPPALEARGDARLLQIALENLLRNAWKFTRQRPRARIEVGVARAEEAAYFVKDDGVGFDPTFATRLFQPFQRLHKASDFEGTGIGLAIVSRIVTGHGGRIWVDASLGDGARFSFTLEPPRKGGLPSTP